MPAPTGCLHFPLGWQVNNTREFVSFHWSPPTFYSQQPNSGFSFEEHQSKKSLRPLLCPIPHSPSPRSSFKKKKLFRGHAHSISLSLVWPPPSPVSCYLRHTSTCAPTLAISPSKKFFSLGPALISIYFFGQATLPLLHLPRKSKRCSSPCRHPCHSWIVRPPKARHFASKEIIILDVPGSTNCTKQKISMRLHRR